MAAINLVLSFFYKPIRKMWHIIILMFFCGLYWELIVPLYRTNSVSDFWDIIAYIVGGVTYRLLITTAHFYNVHKISKGK